MDPYRMVVVHFVAFCFLLGFIFVRYKKAKPLKPFHILVLVLFLPLMSIFRAGTYESGDLTFQAYKTLSFYNSLKEGILIPRWSAELNGTYGYPNFIFAYQLPYYITSFFHFSGFDLIKSVKLLLISTYFFSGVFSMLGSENMLMIFQLYVPQFYIYLLPTGLLTFIFERLQVKIPLL